MKGVSVVDNLMEYEEKIGYTFKDRGILRQALTHSSYANEHKKTSKSYERLEFLGDSLLGFITAEYLFLRHREFPEGQLTKSRAALVCEQSLQGFSKKLDIGKHLRLSHGEINSGGRLRASILADVFESTVAAIYIDSGSLEETKKFVMRFIEPAAKSQDAKPFKDYKTALQEIVQQNPQEKLSYVTIGETGPDHDKRFTVEVRLNSNVIGKGSGKNKREAQQQAARVALSLLGY